MSTKYYKKMRKILGCRFHINNLTISLLRPRFIAWVILERSEESYSIYNINKTEILRFMLRMTTAEILGL